MRVKLYHQPGCPMCKAAMMMMDKKGIEYDESEDVDEMRSLGLSHTPALKVGDEILTGRDIMAWISKSEGGQD